MLSFTLFGFPVRIHWLFWLNSALLGGALNAQTPREIQRVAVWVAMAFLSILIHELGHALVMRRFGDRRVGIVLYAFGGLAKGSGWRSRNEQILVSAAGPALQAAVAALLWVATRGVVPQDPWLLRHAIGVFIFISLFWAAFNLLPIIPMDGGRISEAFLGPSRERLAYGISLAFAGALAGYMLWKGALFPALFFGMLGWNNYQRLNHRPQIPWMDAR